MNDFLVIAFCCDDAVPLALFASRQEAVDYGQQLTPDRVIARGRVISISLTEFVGGLPVAVEVIGKWADGKPD